jgi:hypothetical protein
MTEELNQSELPVLNFLIVLTKKNRKLQSIAAAILSQIGY